MKKFCVVLQGRVILNKFIPSVPLYGRAIFPSTLLRGYISHSIFLHKSYGTSELPDCGNLMGVIKWKTRDGPIRNILFQIGHCSAFLA